MSAESKFVPESNEEMMLAVNSYRTLTIFDQEYRLNTKNCGYRWFRATGDVSRREDGSPYCFFGVFVDITEQKEHTELEKARGEALRKAKNALNAINMLPE